MTELNVRLVTEDLPPAEAVARAVELAQDDVRRHLGVELAPHRFRLTSWTSSAVAASLAHGPGEGTLFEVLASFEVRPPRG